MVDTDCRKKPYSVGNDTFANWKKFVKI